ncbi:MAG: polyprenyl synthetase family protein, partial [Actinomycetota bacterium]
MSVRLRRPAHDVLGDARTLIDPALRSVVGDLPATSRRVAAYHFGWADEAGRPVSVGGGKAIRPALAMLCAEAAGGDPEMALP